MWQDWSEGGWPRTLVAEEILLGRANVRADPEISKGTSLRRVYSEDVRVWEQNQLALVCLGLSQSQHWIPPHSQENRIVSHSIWEGLGQQHWSDGRSLSMSQWIQGGLVWRCLRSEGWGCSRLEASLSRRRRGRQRKRWLDDITDSVDISEQALEVVMDREAWRAAGHGVTKSRTQLSDWTATKALKGVDGLGPSRRAVAWGVATRGQGKLSRESEPKAPEGARQCGAVCEGCPRYRGHVCVPLCCCAVLFWCDWGIGVMSVMWQHVPTAAAPEALCVAVGGGAGVSWGTWTGRLWVGCQRSFPGRSWDGEEKWTQASHLCPRLHTRGSLRAQTQCFGHSQGQSPGQSAPLGPACPPLQYLSSCYLQLVLLQLDTPHPPHCTSFLHHCF